MDSQMNPATSPHNQYDQSISDSRIMHKFINIHVI